VTRIAAARLPDPEPSDAPRAVIGHNRPPPDEAARIDFNEAIDAHDGVRARIAMLVDSSTRAVATNDEEAGRCAELIRQMGAVERVVEDERKSTKEPYLAAGRAIDEAARTLVSPITDAKAKVRSTAESYMREKQRQLDEARREAEAEAQRQREAAAQRAREEAEKAAAENREPELQPEPIYAAPPPKAEPVQVRSDFGAVASARKVKVAVIVDQLKAYKAVKTVPAVQEAIQKAVNGLVRAGQTSIPGVEIRDEIGLSVR
jgi:hypothetical protein